jgi:hypothetical protein
MLIAEQLVFRNGKSIDNAVLKLTQCIASYQPKQGMLEEYFMNLQKHVLHE